MILRITRKNWAFLSKINKLGKNKDQINKMIEIRNRYAHLVINELNYEIICHDIQKIIDFLMFLKVDEKKISEVCKLHQNVCIEKELIFSERRFFMEGFNKSLIKELCNQLISGRGKDLGRNISKQLENDFLNKKTYAQLSRWVNPKKSEPFAQPIAYQISMILYGEKIDRCN